MIVKMLSLQAGPSGVRQPGHVYDVPDKEAKALIEGGYAVEAPKQAKPERAVTGRGRERATAVAEESAEE